MNAQRIGAIGKFDDTHVGNHPAGSDRIWHIGSQRGPALRHTVEQKFEPQLLIQLVGPRCPVAVAVERDHFVEAEAARTHPSKVGNVEYLKKLRAGSESGA